MNFGETFVADPKPTVVVKPGNGPLHNPAVDPQTASVFCVPSGDDRFDVLPAQAPSVGLAIIPTVALDAVRFAARAAALAGDEMWFDETGAGPQGQSGRVRVAPLVYGDVVLARKDGVISYHLAVTVDDALQGITMVTRGNDLFPSTHVHRLLQTLLGLPAPTYRHHRLITDENGKRLAKRDQATSLRHLKSLGVTPAEILDRLGFTSR